MVGCGEPGDKVQLVVVLYNLAFLAMFGGMVILKYYDEPNPLLPLVLDQAAGESLGNPSLFWLASVSIILSVVNVKFSIGLYKEGATDTMSVMNNAISLMASGIMFCLMCPWGTFAIVPLIMGVVALALGLYECLVLVKMAKPEDRKGYSGMSRSMQMSEDGNVVNQSDSSLAWANPGDKVILLSVPHSFIAGIWPALLLGSLLFRLNTDWALQIFPAEAVDALRSSPMMACLRAIGGLTVMRNSVLYYSFYDRGVGNCPEEVKEAGKGKLLFGLVIVGMYHAGAANMGLFMLGIGDLFFGVYFIYAAGKTEPVVESKREPRSKLVKIISSHPGMGGDPDILPEDYLAASGESLFAIMLTSWILAYFFSYETILKNPLKDMFGYNNVCVAWDVAPALYVAPVMWAVPLYCGLRYAVTDYDRYALYVQSGYVKAKIIVNTLYSISMCAVPLIFVITPTVHVIAHTTLFCQLIFFRFLVVAGAFVLLPPGVQASRSQLVFLTVYGLVSVSLLLVSIINMWISPGGWLFSHPIIMQTVDVIWFACLPLTTKNMPYQGRVYIANKVIKDGATYGQVSEDPEALPRAA